MCEAVCMGKVTSHGTPLSGLHVKSYHPQEAFPGSCQLAVIALLLTVLCTAYMSVSKAEPLSDFSLHMQGLG